MNANSGGRDLGGLSLQPNSSAIVCPKCQHKRTPSDSGPDWQCPNCGIAYNKAMPPPADAAPRANTGPSARRAEATRYDDSDTFTPGPISLSLTGRIGRLRYLAFSWPVMLLSALGIVAAIIIPTMHRSPGATLGAGTIFLMAVVMVLWFYLSLRLMALRLHDLNRRKLPPSDELRNPSRVHVDDLVCEKGRRVPLRH